MSSPESPEPTSAPPEGTIRPIAAPGSDPVTTHHIQQGGIGIWCWDVTVSSWTLIEDRSLPGFEPGAGPTGPGRFHGQTVRWASSPRTS